CIEEIKAAERVREECRGWSLAEVNVLKAKLDTLERTSNWSILSASPTTLTLTYRSDLQLFFRPSSFQQSTTTVSPSSSPSPAGDDNSPLSLTYIGDSSSCSSSSSSQRSPQPLTTTKRFFLQLLRANLHSLPQASTPIPSLLALVSQGWQTCLAVSAQVQGLTTAYMTEESILSDERVAVACVLLLPTLQTKVRIGFEIGVGVGGGVGVGVGIHTALTTTAEVVYGERYDEPKMGEFLSQYVGRSVVLSDGERGAGVGAGAGAGAGWRDAVEELGQRLVRRGRKAGGRRV
ncbi:hypothetical protein LTS18_009464, partial [Coniosporium uncinatum]